METCFSELKAWAGKFPQPAEIKLLKSHSFELESAVRGNARAVMIIAKGPTRFPFPSNHGSPYCERENAQNKEGGREGGGETWATEDINSSNSATMYRRQHPTSHFNVALSNVHPRQPPGYD